MVNERQTCNFSDDENFVVLECVHLLLQKGYKPQHIEIEKRWTLGHLQKSNMVSGTNLPPLFFIGGEEVG